VIGITGNQSSPPFLWKGISFKQDDRVLKIGTDALLLATWIPKIISSSQYILDVGTGCGVIALLLAKAFPAAEVIGIDSDLNAVELAIQNAEVAGFENKVRINQSSLEEFAAMPEQKFDLIVSNPPFYLNHILPVSRSMQSAKHATASPAEWMDAMTKILPEEGKIGLILPYAIAFDWIREANQRQWYCTRRLDIYSFAEELHPKRSLLCLSRALDSPMQEKIIMYQQGKSYTIEYQEWLGL